MIWFCYFSQKIFQFWAWPMGTPFAQVRPKNGNFQRFQQFFSRTTGFQLKFFKLIEFLNIFHWKPANKIKVGVVLGQNLGKIRSNVVKKVKKQALSLGFFHIFLREYLLKQKVMVVKPPEWKFMTIIARNAKFKGRQRAKFLPDLNQK